MAGWIETFGGYRMMGGIVISVGLLVIICQKSRKRLFVDTAPSEERESRSNSEDSHLMKSSESCSSSASAFADDSTEVYIKRLKYDSMNKYVKDW